MSATAALCGGRRLFFFGGGTLARAIISRYLAQRRRGAERHSLARDYTTKINKNVVLRETFFPGANVKLFYVNVRLFNISTT